MRVWIVTAGRISVDSLDFYRTVKPAEGDLVICADGGFDNAISFGLAPNIVIGDMDSIRSTVPENIEIIKFPRDKNKTDTHLCVDHAISLGAGEIVLLGTQGGRVDHAIANIMLLRYIAEKGVEGMILAADSRTCLLASGETRISRGDSRFISIVPISRVCKGVTVLGAKYELRDVDLEAGDTIGISNEFLVLDVKVSVKEGELLIIATNE
ncbi:MAG: thiamine diphosphokinase [Clostridiales bacterium]|jgi:thiamine pyrophosphokinase|nr:thiamine diphosphokinase [Clostridiales bacterium]